MTRPDKINLAVALLMMVALLAEGHHIRGNSLAFSIGFPLVIYVLCFWLGRVRTAHWLEKNDQNEIISRRPMTERILNGFFSVCCIWLSYRVVPKLLFAFSDPASWGAAFLLLCLLCLIVLCFLLGAGQRRLRLDVRRQEYSFEQGIPFLTWRKQGKINGGELYISRTRGGYHQVRFRADRWRFGLPIASYESDEDARSEAWQLAEKLGLSVRRRD